MSKTNFDVEHIFPFVVLLLCLGPAFHIQSTSARQQDNVVISSKAIGQMFSKSFESLQKTQQQIGLAANNVLKRAQQCFKTGPMSAQSGALSQMAKGSACVAGREVEMDVELSYN